MTPLRCGKCINTGLQKVILHPKSILSEDRPALLERMKLKVCMCTFTKNSGCVHYDLCSLQYTGIQLWQLLTHQGCISTDIFHTAALTTSFMSIHIHSSDRFRLSEGQEQKNKERVPTACCGTPQCAKSHNAFAVKQVQTVFQHGGQLLWHFIMNESSSFLHWKRALSAIFAHSARISNMEASFFWPVKDGNCDASIVYFSKMMTGMTGTQ